MPTPRMPPHVRAGMAAEITALLNKGVIEPMADHPRLCLSPVFLVPKRSGEFSLDPKPQKDQSLHRVSTLQNGDACVDPSVSEPGRLDCLHRLKRCVSSRTYSRTVKRLARLYVQRKGLSLQSAALRAQARTPHLHKAGRMRGRISPPAGSTHLLLPRRLAAGSPLTPTVKAAPGLPVADSTGPGVLPSEWTLHPQVMATIIRTLGPLHVDLFASALNAQLQRYCAKALDPAAWRIDAFSIRWEGFTGYAFPPISLIPRILQKVRQDRATVLLIAPWWPKRERGSSI